MDSEEQKSDCTERAVWSLIYTIHKSFYVSSTVGEEVICRYGYDYIMSSG